MTLLRSTGANRATPKPTWPLTPGGTIGRRRPTDNLFSSPRAGRVLRPGAGPVSDAGFLVLDVSWFRSPPTWPAYFESIAKAAG